MSAPDITAATGPEPVATTPYGLLRGAGTRRFDKVLITGLGRSGTSAVAWVLKQWGFYLGSHKTWGVLESPELRERMLGGDLDGVVAELERWQAEHGRIAWKEPKLFAGLGAQLIERLPSDWLVIAVFRDPVSVSLRRTKSDGVQFTQALERSSALQTRLAQFAARCNKQVLLVSYERLMTAPEEVLDDITRHLALGEAEPPALAEIWDLLMQQRRNYRTIDRKRLEKKSKAEPPAFAAGPASRLGTFDASSLGQLNALLPWTSTQALAPEMVLGAGRVEPAQPGRPAAEAAALNNLAPLAEASVLVVRCGEGLLAIALAALAKQVWAVDADVEQLVKALVRAWMAGQERQLVLHRFDPARLPWRPQFKALGHAGAFDVVVHADELHRIADPVTELVQCGLLAGRHLMLRTWLPGDELANATFVHESGEYRVFESQPPSIGFDHLVDPQPPMRALTLAALEAALQVAGFSHFEVISLRPQDQGQVVELFASR